ncbi:MAG: hypothetical protein ACK40O_12100, partial [Allosphingosinicella sp.]
MTDRRSAAFAPATALAALLLLAACAESRDPAAGPESGEGGYNLVPPVEAEAMPGAGEALTPGTWQKAGAGDAAALRFVSAQTAEPLFRMDCDGRGGILLDRLGSPAAGTIEMMDVNVGDQVRRLAIDPVEGEVADAAAFETQVVDGDVLQVIHRRQAEADAPHSYPT